jgi:phosphoserine phosphatase
MTWKAVLFDLDGTLTPVRSSWQYIHERLSLWSGRAERHQELFLRGRISYEEFCRLDACEWKGMPARRLEEVTREIGYRPGIEELVAAVRRSGLRAGIVSTGLTLLADRVREELGFDDAQANHLDVEAGSITGTVQVRVRHGRKDLAVRRFCRRFGLGPGEVIAVGDTAGDISMFEAAGWSIAFHPVGDDVARSARAVVPGPGLEDLAAAIEQVRSSGNRAPKRPRRAS